MSSKKDQAGYVPPKPPKKPTEGGQRGYVPPKLPVKPPTKPSSGRK